VTSLPLARLMSAWPKGKSRNPPFPAPLLSSPSAGLDSNEMTGLLSRDRGLQEALHGRRGVDGRNILRPATFMNIE